MTATRAGGGWCRSSRCPASTISLQLPDSHADLPLAIAASALCLWGFIEMYCLKGSRKTNRFGADPLTPPPPHDTRPHWDQQSEIEMVPHKAGPPPAWRVKREA